LSGLEITKVTDNHSSFYRQYPFTSWTLLHRIRTIV